MGFHGKKRSVAMVDRRMQERWERSQSRRLVETLADSPASGETHVSQDKMVHTGNRDGCQLCGANRMTGRD